MATCTSIKDIQGQTERYALLSYDTGSNVTVANNYSLYIRRDGSNMLQGKIKTMDSDGFTIEWTLTGTCALSGMYLALP